MTGRQAEGLGKVLGERTATALAALDVRTVGDLLRHYPRRYGEPGTFTDLASLEPGAHVTVMAKVSSTTLRHMRSRGGALLQTVVTDGTHHLSLTFFAKRPGALRHHEDRLRAGVVGLFTGTASVYRGELQLTHPDFLLLGVDAEDEDAALAELNRPVPIYPASAALASWKVQRAVRTVLGTLTEADVPDPLPGPVRERLGLVPLLQALREVHEPADAGQWQRAQERLRFEEAFVLQVALARRRAAAAAESATARPGRTGGLLDAVDARLPFDLTAGQRAVGEQIAADLGTPHPMQRLLQGEVGSGKTVVALRAMAQVVDSGGQAALLAPTEVLAAQHARSLTAMLGELAAGQPRGGLFDDLAEGPATRVALLTGSQSAAARRQALADAASGAAGIVVGTHALLQGNVQFADLGLVVVDEQHRFGVEQRDLLRAKGDGGVHLLSMTATPIPRTVAMTVFGDLEVSALTEVPAGRSPVVTHVVPADNAAWWDRAWARAREEVDAGHRVYVVCPRISGDGQSGGAAQSGAEADGVELLEQDAPGAGTETVARTPLRAVDEVAAELRTRPELAGIEVGVLHGQLPPDEKEAAMAAFAAGTSPVLVSTTVIEVGVDVPEATLMVILDADRFGLSQLHQLRGRVGRGSAPGLCLLVSAAPANTPASTRLATMVETTDGFRLAEVDLSLRREGDVLGAAQSGGRSSLRLLRVLQDADVIVKARQEAASLVAEDPDLEAWPALRDALEEALDPRREEFLDRA